MSQAEYCLDSAHSGTFNKEQIDKQANGQWTVFGHKKKALITLQPIGISLGHKRYALQLPALGWCQRL
jgi:hypothetical protein